MSWQPPPHPSPPGCAQVDIFLEHPQGIHKLIGSPSSPSGALDLIFESSSVTKEGPWFPLARRNLISFPLHPHQHGANLKCS